MQYALEAEKSRPANKEANKVVQHQQVVGTFLYYCRAVDGTILTTLSAIDSKQASLTENTLQTMKQFMKYAATHPYVVLTHQKSDTIITIHNDAS